MNKKTTLTQTEVLVPIWVLKNIVERDYEEYKRTNAVVGLDVFDELIDEDDDEAMPEAPTSFPELDSTAKCIEILEKYDVYFNVKKGDWE